MCIRDRLRCPASPEPCAKTSPASVRSSPRLVPLLPPASCLQKSSSTPAGAPMPPGRRPAPKARAFSPLHITVDPRRPPPSSTKPIVYVYRHRGFSSSSATAQRYVQLHGFAEYDYSWDPSSSSTGARTTTFDVDFVKYPFGYAKFDYMMRQVPLPSARIPWMRQVPLRTCTTTSTTSCTTTSHYGP